MKRQKIQARPFLLKFERVKTNVIAYIMSLPVDEMEPIEIMVREQIKGRKLDQQALYHAGPLRDISEQAWPNGQKFSVEVWHVFLKRELLPENFNPELCREGYEKWVYDPAGERVLIGSTTQLTIKGFSCFLEGVFAFGAAYGVKFHANPNERD